MGGSITADTSHAPTTERVSVLLTPGVLQRSCFLNDIAEAITGADRWAVSRNINARHHCGGRGEKQRRGGELNLVYRRFYLRKGHFLKRFFPRFFLPPRFAR